MNTNIVNNKQKPCICFGLTLYNKAGYLPEALDSLLNQTYPDFHIVAVDDCSTDDTGKIMQEYMKKDKRVLYFRNEKWTGMIATWQNAFWKSRELFNPEYFAWASDHDRWHPEWLERHVKVLNKYPEVVLAYPDTVAIDANGTVLPSNQSEPFETCGQIKIDRFYQVCRKMSGAGSKVYGLFRAEPLVKAGVFRSLTLPDRLLITELSQYGSFRHIPEQLWYRRYFASTGTFEETVQNQVEKLFGPEQSPFAAHFPYIMHCVSLILSEPFDDERPNFLSRLLLSMIYWESNSGYIIKEISMLDEFLKKGLSRQQFPHDAESLKAISETITGLMGCAKEGPGNTRETVSALLFGTMLFTNYLTPPGAVREKIEQEQKAAQKMKELVEKYKTKLDTSRAETEYWKRAATSGALNRIMLMAKKIFRNK